MLRKWLIRLALSSVADELRSHAGFGAVARVYLGGGTLEQCISAYVTLSPTPADDKALRVANKTIGYYIAKPVRTSLSGLMLASEDVQTLCDELATKVVG